VTVIPLLSLWLPILVSALLVFAGSCAIHMVFRYHNRDFAKIPNEDEILEFLAKFELPPGAYLFPWSDCGKDFGKEAFKAKLARGPAGFLTVFPRGPLGMAQSMVLWFGYCIVVGTFAGYIAGRALPSAAAYLQVFRFAGATAFAGYSLALLQNSIWYKHPWTATAKGVFDGLLYALITGATFGWLWPR
jgi:hypothetical protein